MQRACEPRAVPTRAPFSKPARSCRCAKDLSPLDLLNGDASVIDIGSDASCTDKIRSLLARAQSKAGNTQKQLQGPHSAARSPSNPAELSSQASSNRTTSSRAPGSGTAPGFGTASGSGTAHGSGTASGSGTDGGGNAPATAAARIMAARSPADVAAVMRDLPRDHQLLRLNKWADLDPAALAATRTLTAASKHAIGQVLHLLPDYGNGFPALCSYLDAFPWGVLSQCGWPHLPRALALPPKISARCWILLGTRLRQSAGNFQQDQGPALSAHCRAAHCKACAYRH